MLRIAFQKKLKPLQDPKSASRVGIWGDTILIIRPRNAESREKEG